MAGIDYTIFAKIRGGVLWFTKTLTGSHVIQAIQATLQLLLLFVSLSKKN